MEPPPSLYRVPVYPPPLFAGLASISDYYYISFSYTISIHIFNLSYVIEYKNYHCLNDKYIYIFINSVLWNF